MTSSQTALNLLNIFAPTPSTKRGSPVVLGAEPKTQNTIVYATGTSIVIRNIEDLRVADLYLEHSAQTTVAKYSNSGFYIASGDVQGTIRIWDTTQKEHVLKIELRVLSGPILDIAWSPDNQRILAVGDGKEKFGSVFMWDAGSSVGEITGHSKCLASGDFRPARPFRLITCGEDMSIGWFEGPPFKFKKSIKEHSRFVNCVRFSPDGSRFASASSDKKVILFEGKTGEKLTELEPIHKGGVYSVAWSPDNSQLLTASADKTAVFWDVSSGKPIKQVHFGDSLESQQLGSLWMGKHILTVNLDGDINCLDIDSDKPARTIYGHNKYITAMCYHSDSLFTGSYDARLLQWNVKTGESILFQGKGHTNQIVQMVVDDRTPDTKLVTGSSDDTFRVNNIATRTYGDAVPTEAPCTGVALHDLSNIVVTTIKSVLVFKDSSCLCSLDAPWNPTCVSVSPNGDIAVGANDKTIKIFTLENNALVKKTELTDSIRGTLTAIAYSPDGRWLASADSSRNVYIWEVSTGKLFVTGWIFHNAKVNTLNWSPDSNLLASGSLDSSIYVWNVEHPEKRIYSKLAHFGGVNVVAWTSTSTLASAGADSAVKLWGITQ